MEVQIDFEHGREELENLPLTELTNFVLQHEGLPANTEVSISFVSDERMADLNLAYRGIEGPTDVLSFECDGADDAWDEGTGAEDATFVLGDIVIAPDVARRQTAEYRTTFEGEISLLLVHGLLHLCGYDHEEDDEAQAMEQLEGEIIALWWANR